MIHLIHRPLAVELELNNLTGRISVPMVNNMALKIHKGLDNAVLFKVHDNDRKPVKFLDKRLDIYVSFKTTGEQALVRQLEVLDEYKGHAVLRLTPADTAGWPLGHYEFNVTMRDEEDNAGFLYYDFAYGIAGSLELCQSAIVPPQEPVVLTQFYSDIDKKTRFMSDRVPGRKTKFFLTGPSIASFSLAGFAGTVSVEGSNYTDASNKGLSDPWQVVYTRSFTSTVTSSFDVELLESFEWMRFVYEVSSPSPTVSVSYRV